MSWLAEHWQTVVALTIVGVTAAVFLRKVLTREKSGCSGGCGCEAAKGLRLK